MKKKSVIVLLAGVMLTFAVLAGCGSGKNENASSNEPAKSTDSQSSSGSTGAQDKAPEPLKMKITLETGGNTYIEGSPNLKDDPYVKEFEKLSNTDITFQLIPHQDYNQKLQLVIAGGDLGDLLQTHGINEKEIAPLIDANALLPLNDLIDKYAPNLKAKVPAESWTSGRVSKDGVIYGIPQENPIRNGTVVYMRKDWLDKLGLQPPRTVEEYLKVLRAFRDGDPNGNGQPDEIPLGGREKWSHTTMFFGAYDVLPDSWRFVNGQLVPNFIRPEMKEALKLYRQLYKEKLLDNEFLTTKGADWDTKITGKGIVGMWAHAATYPDNWQSRLGANVPGAQITIVPAPVGPSGKPGGVYAVGSTVSDFIWTIPKTAKDPVAIIKFLDWFYSDQAPKDFFLYGLEGKDYTKDGSTIKYNYPTDADGYSKESVHQGWLHFTGKKYELEDENFIKGRNLGDLILQGINVAAKEGQKDDALDMPTLPAVSKDPDLSWKGLFLTFASQVVAGQKSADDFDKFVADWKARGGDEWIKEATDWYNKNHK